MSGQRPGHLDSVRLETLSPGIHRIAASFPLPLGSVNSYLLSGGDDLVVVDTAFVPSEGCDHVAALVAYAGKSLQDITRIVITHMHRDHAGGLSKLQKASGAPVFFHEAERFTLAEAEERSLHNGVLARWMRRHGLPVGEAKRIEAAIRWRAPEPFANPIRVEDGTEIAVGSLRWQVLHTPGHTPGHICLFEPVGGFLITGDHVLPNESSNISVRPGQPYDPLGAYLRALRRVVGLRAVLCLPGHGQPFPDISEVVDHQIRHHSIRLRDVRQALAVRPQTTFRVALTIPWVQRAKRFGDLNPRDRFLAFGETLAHLECLEARGEAFRVETDPITWRAA